MKLISNRNNTDPALNLALEEYALRNLDINNIWLLVYVNEPSVIIGKNQNFVEELNLKFLEKANIPFYRRISGGGAVYHDEGNLNFSFIRKYTPQHFNNYTEALTPIVEAINELEVNAEINERNDVVVGKKKVSGNAQFTSRDRMLTHGTLLYDADIYNLTSALKSKAQLVESKSTKSVRSKVANIIDLMEEDIEIEEFRELVLKHIFKDEDYEVFDFSDDEWLKIKELADEKYRTWEWNFARTPKFSIKGKTKNDKIKIKATVDKGLIEEISFEAADELNKIIPDSLTGVKFSRTEMVAKLLEADSDKISEEFANEIVNAMY